MESSSPSSRVSSAMPSHTPSTPSARPSHPSMSSTLSSARDVPSTASVVKQVHDISQRAWLGVEVVAMKIQILHASVFSVARW